MIQKLIIDLVANIRRLWVDPVSFRLSGIALRDASEVASMEGTEILEPEIGSTSRMRGLNVEERRTGCEEGFNASTSLGKLWRQMSALAQLLCQIAGPSSAEIISNLFSSIPYLLIDKMTGVSCLETV